MNDLTSDYYFQKTFLEEIQEKTKRKVNYKTPEERLQETIEKNIARIKNDICDYADMGIASVKYEYDISETKNNDSRFSENVLEYFRKEGFGVETIVGEKSGIAMGHVVLNSQKITTTISW